MYKELAYDHETDLVKKIQFGVLSPDEIRKRSVVEVTKNEIFVGTEPVPNGLFDPRMGVIDHNKYCQTCNQKNTFCPGHFGHVQLGKPVFYIQFVKTVEKILKCVCFRCSKLLADVNAPEVQAVLAKKLSAQKRWELMYKLCSKSRNNKRCGGGNGNHEGCGAKQPDKIYKEGVIKIAMEWKEKETTGEDAVRKVVLTAEDVLRILRRLSDEDIEALGFSTKYNRPEWMICTVLPVPPPAVRPSVRSDIGQRSEDDLTHKLTSIIKANNQLKGRLEKGTKEQVDIATQLLQYEVATLIDNQIPGISPAMQRTGRPLRSLAERLKSKEGRIRGNLMGKRVDFSARSVITPDPCISIDELGVPLKIAMNLTFPEIVNEENIELMRKLIQNGPDVYPGAKFVRKLTEGRTIRLKNVDPSTIDLRPGDVVERHMRDGDYVLFNRQPSLHKMSMMAHRVRVMPYNTFRLNVCVTPSFNADFDGDEMNLHLPQSIQTHEELRQLAAVPTQIISPREAKPIISIVQDVALGVYRMTKDHTRISQKAYYNILSTIPKFTGDTPSPKEKGPDMWTGRQLLSMILPKNINTIMGDVVIENGELLKGTVGKDVYQARTQGLVHSIYNEYGPDETRQFFDNTQRIVCDWLVLNGFSVGISDLVVTDKDLEQFHVVIKSMKEEVYNIMNQVHTDTFENLTTKDNADYFEQKVNDLLNSANGKVGKLATANINDLNNRMLNMINSKSKGNTINVAQMIGCLGQQNVDGRRIPYGFDDRTLPHYTKYDDGPESRGFVASSFIQGLTPQEFFFHSMGGREGLIDTAVKTSDTGYIQRKLVKAMEDCKVYYDLSVRNASGSIVQFYYGEDGMDASKIEHQPLPTVSMDLPSLRKEFLISQADMDSGRFDQVLSKTVINALVESPDTWVDRMEKHFQQILEDRTYIITKIFKNKNKESLMYPIAFQRILTAVQHRMSKAMGGTHHTPAAMESDLSPVYVLDTIERLQKKLTLKASTDSVRGDHESSGTHLLHMLLRMNLSPKRMLLKYRFDKDGFDFVVQKIQARFFESLAHPSEMVGVVAAQSVGEPCTQLVLNSVEYNTEILLDVNGKLQRVKMGEFVDGTITNRPAETMEDHPQDTKLAWTKDLNLKILSCDESGRVAWKEVEAVTRHPPINADGTHTLVRVLCQSGREVTATKAKSFLKRVNNKIVPVRGDELKVGDYLPVSTILPVKGAVPEVTVLEVQYILPKTQWLYMSEVQKAKEAWQEAQNAGERNWFSHQQGKRFTVPYSRSDSLADGMGFGKLGKRQVNDVLPDCVYPKSSNYQCAHIPENIPLDEAFGFFVGAYLAEGCCTKHHVLIANVDDAFNARIDAFCKTYKIEYHIDDQIKNNGRSKTLRLHSYVLAQLLQKLMGRTSAHKRFPAHLLAAPEPFLRQVISGYFSGDGWIPERKCCVMASSISKGLLEDMQQILTRFGVACSIKPQQAQLEYALKRGLRARLPYLLYVSASSVPAFRDAFELANEAKQTRLHAWSPTHTYASMDIIPEIVTSKLGVLTNVPRSKLADLLAQLQGDDKEVVESVLKETIVYDRIVCIEEVDSTHPYVYDFTIKDTRTFNIYNGLCQYDTFHLSGVSAASSAVRGVPRLRELLSVTKNMKTPIMKIFVSHDVSSDKQKCMELSNELRIVRVRDIIESCKVYFDPSDGSNTLTHIEEDRSFMQFYDDFRSAMGPQTRCDEKTSPWLLRLELNKAKMLQYKISMLDIHRALVYYYDDAVSCVFSDDNAERLIFRIKLVIEDDAACDDMLTELRALEHNIMETITLKGIKNIEKVSMYHEKDHMVYRPEDGAFVQSPEWIIDTMGSNLLEMLGCSFVDQTRTTTNNVPEIYSVLGVEAARMALYNEIMDVLDQSYVDYRHIAMLVDTMTNKGNLLSIDRHGINRGDIGPLAKCSFEEVNDMLIKAGVFAEADKINGVSANIILGQIAPCGTGDGAIMIDESMLSQIEEEEDEKATVIEHDEEEDVCAWKNIATDFKLPDADAKIERISIKIH